MKELKLTVFILSLPLLVFAENLIQYPEDLASDAWSRYGAPAITANGDGSQTVAQSVAAPNYVQQLMYTNELLTEGESYLFRVQIKPTSGEFARVRVNRYKNGSSYETFAPSTTPLDLVDWVPFTIPFQANMESSNPGYFQIEGPDTASSIRIKSLQIAVNPGTTLYSTGDSICDFSINDTVPDSSSQYTAFYAFSENIVAEKTGIAGGKLADINSNMQTDLASTHYPVIFIEGGFNDINVGPTPLAEMQTVMSAMIAYAKTRADHVVVFNVPPTLPQAQRALQYGYNTWLVTECANQGVQHFDMVAVLGTGGGAYGLDRNMDYYAAAGGGATHPNAAGHEALARALSGQVSLPSSKLLVESLEDDDGDGFTNEEEIEATSDPDNPASKPGMTTMTLQVGYNQVSFPAEVLFYHNMEGLLEALGGNRVIDRALVLDSASQNYLEAGYDPDGLFYGDNIPLAAGQGLSGLILYARQYEEFAFSSKYCHTWELVPGKNLVGSGCIPDGLKASELLQHIGDETVVTSIQRFNSITGEFETCAYNEGVPDGGDFSIHPGEGYFINMKQEITGFVP